MTLSAKDYKGQEMIGKDYSDMAHHRAELRQLAFYAFARWLLKIIAFAALSMAVGAVFGVGLLA